MTAWPTVRLGDVVQAVLTGPFGSILHQSDYAEVGVPLVNPANIVGEQISSDGIKYVSFSKAQTLPGYALQNGDIVIGRRGEIGRCAVVTEGEAGWLCGTGSFIIRPGKSLDSRFLAMMIRSPHCLAELEKSASGATMPNLSNGTLRSLRIPLPPLEEQRRIVAVLDKAFAAIATATANAEKNLANAREVRGLLHQQAFESFNLRQPLGRLASFRNGVNFTSTSRGEEIQIVGVKDFRDNVFVPDDDLAIVRLDGSLPEEDLLRAGDILTVRSNGNKALIGRCMTAERVEGRITHSGFTIRIRPDVDRVDSEYLCRYLRSPEARERLVASGAGANISSLNQKVLASLPVPVPSREDQRRVVDSLTEADELVASLESCVRAKQVALANLKQSLLHRAFSGDLTEREPLAA